MAGFQRKEGPNEDQMLCPNQKFLTYQVQHQALHSGKQVPVSQCEMSPKHYVRANT